ncbi:MAG: hypothetical protein AB1813_06845 [Verrucomicrobiota bacterium]
MNEADFQELLDQSLRRPLTDAEEKALRAWCATRPHLQPDEELALNQLVRQLPPAPVPSNFTALVLQSVRKEAEAQARHPWNAWLERWRIGGWVPRLALGGAIVMVSLMGYRAYQVSQRVERAENLARVSSVASLPDLEMLKDFQAIQLLRNPTNSLKALEEADLLLAALQE